QLPQGQRRQDEQHGEEQQAVEDLVPHRLAEGVARDGPDPPHEARRSSAAGTAWASRRKMSSSDSLRGDTDRTDAPAARALPRKASTSVPSASSMSTPSAPCRWRAPGGRPGIPAAPGRSNTSVDSSRADSKVP